MALNLDPRQREMLKEMGITLWQAPPPPVAAPVAAAAADAATSATAAQRAARPAATPAAAAPAAPPAAATRPTPHGDAPAHATSATGASTAPSGWALAPALAAYPQAAAQPGQPRWLVLAECTQAQAPLADSAGALLDQMLRALRLQHNPQVFIAPVLAAGQPGASLGLTDVLQHTQPTVVLALGLPAARLALGGQAPLGRLRASPQSGPGGVTVVVSYAPQHLLRAPAHKAAAWADLCRAHSLAGRVNKD